MQRYIKKLPKPTILKSIFASQPIKWVEINKHMVRDFGCKI